MVTSPMGRDRGKKYTFVSRESKRISRFLVNLGVGSLFFREREKPYETPFCETRTYAKIIWDLRFQSSCPFSIKVRTHHVYFKLNLLLQLGNMLGYANFAHHVDVLPNKSKSE